MENKVKPITPKEIEAYRQIPDEIFVAVNSLIAEKFNGNYATVKVNEIIARLDLQKMGTNRNTVITKYLNIENHYRNAGWEVEYDQPSYGDDDFESYFKFTAK